MKRLTFSLVILGLIVGGCSFGEYADKDENIDTDKAIATDGTVTYKFTAENTKYKTYFKVFKVDENWSMVEYDFNQTNFSANQIKGGVGSNQGTYTITDEGYLKLISLDITTWIKPTNEDNDKIWLLWTTSEGDLSKTTPSENTYFFKTKNKADEFIE